jgi:hypothetical protein
VYEETTKTGCVASFLEKIFNEGGEKKQNRSAEDVGSAKNCGDMETPRLGAGVHAAVLLSAFYNNGRISVMLI